MSGQINPSFWSTSSGTATPVAWQALGTPPTPEETSLPAPRFLHIIEQGGLVRKVGQRIQVVKKGNLLLEVQTVKLQGVVIYGNAQVSSQCLRLLLEQGVWLSFFTRQGHYKDGSNLPPSWARICGVTNG